MTKLIKSLKRCTIILEPEIESKLREIQAKLIIEDGKGYSFSKVINMILLTGIISVESLDYKQLYMIKTMMGRKDISLNEFINREHVIKIAEKSKLI